MGVLIMKELELHTFSEPILRLQADPVLHVGEHERQLLKSMLKSMWNWKGVGLAAPQVGFSSRLIVAEAEGVKLPSPNRKFWKAKVSIQWWKVACAFPVRK